MEYSYCNLILGKIYHFDPVCPFYTLHAKCFLNCVSTVTESPVAAIVSTYPRACFASFSRSVPYSICLFAFPPLVSWGLRSIVLCEILHGTSPQRLPAGCRWVACSVVRSLYGMEKLLGAFT